MTSHVRSKIKCLTNFERHESWARSDIKRIRSQKIYLDRVPDTKKKGLASDPVRPTIDFSLGRKFELRLASSCRLRRNNHRGAINVAVLHEMLNILADQDNELLMVILIVCSMTVRGIKIAELGN